MKHVRFKEKNKQLIIERAFVASDHYDGTVGLIRTICIKGRKRPVDATWRYSTYSPKTIRFTGNDGTSELLCIYRPVIGDDSKAKAFKIGCIEQINISYKGSGATIDLVANEVIFDGDNNPFDWITENLE